GGDEPWCNAVHGDPVDPRFIGQSSGEPDHAAFTRDVGGKLRVADQKGRGADVHDTPVAALDHRRPYGMCHEEHPVEVRGEHSSPLVESELSERRVWVDAGVVHEDVDTTGGGENLLGRERHAGGIRDVHLKHSGALPEGPGDSLRGVAVLVEEGDVSPVGGEPRGGCAPDTASGPRYDRDLTC